MSQQRALGPVRPGGGWGSAPPAPQQQHPQVPQRQLVPSGGLGRPGAGYAPPPPPPSGDPGYSVSPPPGMGGNAPVSQAQLRIALADMRDQYQRDMGGLDGRIGAAENQILRFVDQPDKNPLAGLGGLDLKTIGMPALSGDILQKNLVGRCLPYVAVLDVFVPKGAVGEQFTGSIFITADGPLVIARSIVYAQIDPTDLRGNKFPEALIDVPSCINSNDPSVLAAANQGAVFNVQCSDLLPKLNVGGMYIPTSPRNCRLITAGTEVCCGTLTCPGPSPFTKSYAVRQPIVMLDHPECVDGSVEISTNDCGWQNVPVPLAYFEDGMFDIVNENPGCFGVCGFLDCQKVLQVGFTPSRALRFDVNLSFVFAGFRIITCGPQGCQTS